MTFSVLTPASGTLGAVEPMRDPYVLLVSADEPLAQAVRAARLDLEDWSMIGFRT